MFAVAPPFPAGYTVSGTMTASWVVAKIVWSAVVRAGKLKDEVPGPAATLICIMVRVFGPYPGMVLGAPPASDWSGLPV